MCKFWDCSNLFYCNMIVKWKILGVDLGCEWELGFRTNKVFRTTTVLKYKVACEQFGLTINLLFLELENVIATSFSSFSLVMFNYLWRDNGNGPRVTWKVSSWRSSGCWWDECDILFWHHLWFGEDFELVQCFGTKSCMHDENYALFPFSFVLFISIS